MPGLLFSLKREYQESTAYFPSFDNSDTFDSYHFKSSINEYYLDFPITVKFNFIIGNLNFYALTGPYFNLLLFDHTATELFVNEEIIEMENVIEGKFSNRIDYGIKIGLGAEMRSFVIQVSYDYGFYRSMQYEEIQFDQSVRNSVIGLSLGYKM